MEPNRVPPLYLLWGLRHITYPTWVDSPHLWRCISQLEFNHRSRATVVMCQGFSLIQLWQLVKPSLGGSSLPAWCWYLRSSEDADGCKVEKNKDKLESMDINRSLPGPAWTSVSPYCLQLQWSWVLRERPGHPSSHSHTHLVQEMVKMKENPGEGGANSMAAAPSQQGESTDQRQGGGV